MGSSSQNDLLEEALRRVLAKSPEKSPDTTTSDLAEAFRHYTKLPFNFHFNRRSWRIVVFPTGQSFRWQPLAENHDSVTKIVAYLNKVAERSAAGELIPGVLYRLGQSTHSDQDPPFLPVVDYYNESRVGRAPRHTLVRARLDREMFGGREKLLAHDSEWSYRDLHSCNTFSVIFDPDTPEGATLEALDESEDSGESLRWYPARDQIPLLIRCEWPIRIVDLCEAIGLVVRQTDRAPA